MAKLALLARSSFTVGQPEVECRRPEVETMGRVCPLQVDGVTVSARMPVTRSASAESEASPPRTGSGFPSKHFRSASIVDPVTADELASLLGGETAGRPVVVVDCRTFLAFNVNHIAGAFNASCGDRLSRKRLVQGRATVADLVSSGGPASNEVGGSREAYRRLADTTSSSPEGLFVAYDDNTVNLDALQATHPLRLLTSSLTEGGYHTKYLSGKSCIVTAWSVWWTVGTSARLDLLLAMCQTPIF